MQTPLTENGQSGFQEGNAAQYTWMVPQDLRDLINALGGARAAAAKLDAFFAQLNAGQDKPYAWLGNEPSIGTPWVYLSAGEPWRAQAILRQAMTTLYSDAPDGLPGNDDLGTMSAWYVWCAMGLYPQNPAMRYLDIGAPLFRSVRIESPSGLTLEVSASERGNRRTIRRGVTRRRTLERQELDRAPRSRKGAAGFHARRHGRRTLGHRPRGCAARRTRCARRRFRLATAAEFVSPQLPSSFEPATGSERRSRLTCRIALEKRPQTSPGAQRSPRGLHVDDSGGKISVAPHAERAVDLRLTAGGALQHRLLRRSLRRQRAERRAPRTPRSARTRRATATSGRRWRMRPIASATA